MSAALQIYSRDFDGDFFKLAPSVRDRIESAIDRLGTALDTHPHHRMKGVEAFRLRVGDYRVIYDFERAKGVLYLLGLGIDAKVPDPGLRRPRDRRSARKVAGTSRPAPGSAGSMRI